MSWSEKRKEAAAFIRPRIGVPPIIGLILGSGLGRLADEIVESVVIPYRDVPHFPASTVEGHAGRLVIGILEGKPVVAMQGRFHYYEGYSMQQVAFPVWVMWEIGVRTLIATNAAGGMNRSFRPGDLMIITDHLNMTFDNPLIGPNDPELGPRFPAMRRAYTRSLVDLALRVADEQRIHVQKGIYVMTTGPMYETRAMGQVFRLLGGDAVGMSTVPEIIAATHAGMQTLAISVITDVAKEDPQQFTTHEEVLAVAERTLPIFISYLRAIIRALPV
jgi:purine-nucleoside phosphorylase